MAAESQSLSRLYELMQRCIETCALWKTLGDHQLQLIIIRLPQVNLGFFVQLKYSTIKLK